MRQFSKHRVYFLSLTASLKDRQMDILLHVCVVIETEMCS
jgi:hypothetical protein